MASVGTAVTLVCAVVAWDAISSLRGSASDVVADIIALGGSLNKNFFNPVLIRAWKTPLPLIGVPVVENKLHSGC